MRRSAASCRSSPRAITSRSCCRWSRTWSAAANLDLSDLDAIAYTAGPGLIGALLVGGSLAASLAYSLRIPAVPVHHLEGHLLASMLEAEPPAFPFLALLVSGGHTQLIEVAALGRYAIIGETLDDAAGEAFDKVARLLGLPYPGGPELARLAEAGDPERFALPRPLKNQGLDFSFSGLKTAARLAIDSRARAAHGARSRNSGRHRGVIPGGSGRHAREQVPQGARGDRARAARDRRRRWSEQAAAGEPRDARTSNRRSRVLSAAGALHGQRGDDRVRRLVSAYSSRARLAAADHREAALAARRARAGRANGAIEEG